MLERERTYLAKKLPTDLESAPSKEMIDRYIPVSSPHPVLRLRQQGDRLEMTKKQPLKDGDATQQVEQTISLSQSEFDALSRLPNKEVRKRRYYYPYQDRTIEIDVFGGQLAGLAVVDIEFDSDEEQLNFVQPDFCLTEVSQQTFLAGGMLCGKSYQDIQDQLTALGYQKIP